ncbi:hypothetical protein ASG87_08345 [Frateuria sp. Soil773]|uniref:DUF4124 domain-containing protein n=1 Tax=Frateuria sp. Soil773 TaxID=1736407 RepID=UPI0006F4B4D3|nr:DUF4124 domain-containing protein [Frateuria sp. Soil773]KRE88582.1 hypothetical protein ASG87_08345 [Frateuria sp. Soil773]
MRRPLLAAALLLLTPIAFAQAYKWTDSHGTVHYSETPPAQGTRFQKVATTGTAEPLSKPAAPEQVPASSPASGPVADTPENRSKLCTSLKMNMDALNAKGPVVMETNGRQQALDDNQRQQQLASANMDYQRYCVPR